MIYADGFVSWARRIDGLPDKVYSQPNTGIGFACHSVVGEEADFQDGIPNRFLSTERDANGRYTDYAAASVTFVLRKSGILIQMYPITASTWTSGSRAANTQYIAMELEGGAAPDYGEPMTAAQAGAFVLLIRELEFHKGIRYVPDVNILQHKQLVAMYGGAPTACASDRYQRGYDILLADEEESMTPTQLRILRAVSDLLVGPPDSETDADGDRADMLEAEVARESPVVGRIAGLSDQLANHGEVARWTLEQIETIAVEAVTDKLLGN